MNTDGRLSFSCLSYALMSSVTISEMHLILSTVSSLFLVSLDSSINIKYK